MGYIRITSVEEVQLDDLTDEDAPLDGFDNVQQWRTELARFYPQELTAGYRAYRVAFVREPEESEHPLLPPVTNINVTPPA